MHNYQYKPLQISFTKMAVSRVSKDTVGPGSDGWNWQASPQQRVLSSALRMQPRAKREIHTHTQQIKKREGMSSCRTERCHLLCNEKKPRWGQDGGAGEGGGSKDRRTEQLDTSVDNFSLCSVRHVRAQSTPGVQHDTCFGYCVLLLRQWKTG